MGKIKEEIDGLRRENVMICSCGNIVTPKCDINDSMIDLKYECPCGREWKIEGVKKFYNGDMDMKPHIKSGVKIIFSFKTEYYYLYDGNVLIDKYEVFKDAQEKMDIFITACSYGERKENIYEFIRDRE